MIWPIILQTERLVLRPLSESDVKLLFSYATYSNIDSPTSSLTQQSIEETAQIIREILSMPETFAITLRESEGADVPVGAIGLRVGDASDLALDNDQAELGYWIGKPLWGMGYMPEAVREVLRHGFCDLGLEAIWIGHASDNEQDVILKEDVGFSRQRSVEGRPRTQVGDYASEDRNWITREEWETLQAADPVDEAVVQAQEREADEVAISLPRISYIRSGGQTGADRGALDAAREAGVPICGWCPQGGLAEDMPEEPGLLADYPELLEVDSASYVVRTAWNVRDAHATLIVAPAGLEPKSGTEMTARFARDFGRPYLVIQGIEELDAVRTWLSSLGCGITLNVAGPRESKTPGTYELTKRIVAQLLDR